MKGAVTQKEGSSRTGGGAVRHRKGGGKGQHAGKSYPPHNNAPAPASAASAGVGGGTTLRSLDELRDAWLTRNSSDTVTSTPAGPPPAPPFTEKASAHGQHQRREATNRRGNCGAAASSSGHTSVRAPVENSSTAVATEATSGRSGGRAEKEKHKTTVIASNNNAPTASGAALLTILKAGPSPCTNGMGYPHQSSFPSRQVANEPWGNTSGHQYNYHNHQYNYHNHLHYEPGPPSADWGKNQQPDAAVQQQPEASWNHGGAKYYHASSPYQVYDAEPAPTRETRHEREVFLKCRRPNPRPQGVKFPLSLEIPDDAFEEEDWEKTQELEQPGSYSGQLDQQRDAGQADSSSRRHRDRGDRGLTREERREQRAERRAERNALREAQEETGAAVDLPQSLNDASANHGGLRSSTALGATREGDATDPFLQGAGADDAFFLESEEEDEMEMEGEDYSASARGSSTCGQRHSGQRHPQSVGQGLQESRGFSKWFGGTQERRRPAEAGMSTDEGSGTEDSSDEYQTTPLLQAKGLVDAAGKSEVEEQRSSSRAFD